MVPLELRKYCSLFIVMFVGPMHTHSPGNNIVHSHFCQVTKNHWLLLGLRSKLGWKLRNNNHCIWKWRSKLLKELQQPFRVINSSINYSMKHNFSKTDKQFSTNHQLRARIIGGIRMQHAKSLHLHQKGKDPKSQKEFFECGGPCKESSV